MIMGRKFEMRPRQDSDIESNDKNVIIIRKNRSK